MVAGHGGTRGRAVTGSAAADGGGQGRLLPGFRTVAGPHYHRGPR
ncbi:hypothetical protein SCATT_38150 [Streptantibioticus cattleyicolor NRRL 8057 = DSM 46488]|uniref:Uncharacterized protein n=1 Tax=Streptantibioticus cattleyicolor (strain ATCC 35852 / DSM 46488 / JCM 4925 / NBRC 14057 / NRRL 8057) TaxID=1003195 RepID=G8WR30_STREN|nr:hypothetical protein SCATT_38150 [Streptantibioticus cattleyicolor NRRL 8057 = DSM 46488]